MDPDFLVLGLNISCRRGGWGSCCKEECTGRVDGTENTRITGMMDEINGVRVEAATSGLVKYHPSGLLKKLLR